MNWLILLVLALILCFVVGVVLDGILWIGGPILATGAWIVVSLFFLGLGGAGLNMYIAFHVVFVIYRLVTKR